jgi:hypothetical protein
MGSPACPLGQGAIMDDKPESSVAAVKLKLSIATALLSFALASPARADYQDGKKAFDRGY